MALQQYTVRDKQNAFSSSIYECCRDNSFMIIIFFPVSVSVPSSIPTLSLGHSRGISSRFPAPPPDVVLSLGRVSVLLPPPLRSCSPSKKGLMLTDHINSSELFRRLLSAPAERPPSALDSLHSARLGFRDLAIALGAWGFANSPRSGVLQNSHRGRSKDQRSRLGSQQEEKDSYRTVVSGQGLPL